MARPRHPKKAIEAVIQYAESLGWIVKVGGSHNWGQILCPFGHKDCRLGVHSTPRDPEDHAKDLKGKSTAAPGNKQEHKMPKYNFDIYVEGVPLDDDGFGAFCESLFAIVDDCTPSPDSIAFAREATGLREAIVSAAESIHRADPTVTITGVRMVEDGASIDDLLFAAAS